MKSSLLALLVLCSIGAEAATNTLVCNYVIRHDRTISEADGLVSAQKMTVLDDGVKFTVITAGQYNNIPDKLVSPELTYFNNKKRLLAVSDKASNGTFSIFNKENGTYKVTNVNSSDKARFILDLYSCK